MKCVHIRDTFSFQIKQNGLLDVRQVIEMDSAATDGISVTIHWELMRRFPKFIYNILVSC